MGNLILIEFPKKFFMQLRNETKLLSKCIKSCIICLKEMIHMEWMFLILNVFIIADVSYVVIKKRYDKEFNSIAKKALYWMGIIFIIGVNVLSIIHNLF